MYSTNNTCTVRSTEEAMIENVYVHLVNNSIGKNSENFGNVVTAENGETIEVIS